MSYACLFKCEAQYLVVGLYVVECQALDVVGLNLLDVLAVLVREDKLRDICELFDVDFLEGKREFSNANKAWDAQYSRKAVLSTNTKPEAVKKRKYTRRVETVTEQPQALSDSVLEVLYGKLPQKVFRAILEGTESEIDPLEYLYDKVDFNDYMKIYNAMKEVK